MFERVHDADAASRNLTTACLADVLGQENDVSFAYLFGSFIEERRFHDIDVGIYVTAAARAPVDRSLDLAARLSRAAGYPVDVRVLNDAPLTFLSMPFVADCCCAGTMNCFQGFWSAPRSGIWTSNRFCAERPGRHSPLDSQSRSRAIALRRDRQLGCRLEQLRIMPRERFLTDQDAKDIACYRLLVAIEAALALCYHVSAVRLKVVPDEYAACFGVLEGAASL